MQSYLKEKGSGNVFPLRNGLQFLGFTYPPDPHEMSIREVLRVTNFCFFFITKREMCYLLYRYNNHTKRMYKHMMKQLSTFPEEVVCRLGVSKDVPKKYLEEYKKTLESDLNDMEKFCQNHINLYIGRFNIFRWSFEIFIMRYGKSWNNFLQECEEKGRKYIYDKSLDYKLEKLKYAK